MLLAIALTFAAALAAQTGGDMVAFPAPWTSPYRVDPAYPHHLVNREGRHLFILNKTAWAFFGCKDPKGVLERARAQGVTVIRVALEGTPYFEQLGIDMWPWGGTRAKPDWTGFNRAYWDEVERRTRMAGEHGIGLNVTVYMALHPEASDIAAQRAYWDQALRRLGRYANVLTWEMANEYTRNEAFQDAAGAYFKQHDQHRRPVCSSDGTTDDALWPNKPWMDLAIVHTCTGSQYDLAGWYQAVARNTRSHGKPAFNNESGREKRHRNDDPVHRRKQGWLWNASGAFWTWHSWEGCEGIDDAAYRGPGAEFNKPMSDFFQSLPFWRMGPNATAIAADHASLVQSAIADPGRGIVAAYLCTRASGEAVPASRARLRLPNGVYSVTFIDPRNLRASAPVRVETAGIGRVAEIDLPAFTDDLMVKIERVAERRRTVVEGTK